MLGLRTFGLRAVMSSTKTVMLVMGIEMFGNVVRNVCSNMEMLHSVLRNVFSHQQDVLLGLITCECRAQIPHVRTELVMMVMEMF